MTEKEQAALNELIEDLQNEAMSLLSNTNTDDDKGVLIKTLKSTSLLHAEQKLLGGTDKRMKEIEDIRNDLLELVLSQRTLYGEIMMFLKSLTHEREAYGKVDMERAEEQQKALMFVSISFLTKTMKILDRLEALDKSMVA